MGKGKKGGKYEIMDYWTWLDRNESLIENGEDGDTEYYWSELYGTQIYPDIYDYEEMKHWYWSQVKDFEDYSEF